MSGKISCSTLLFLFCRHFFQILCFEQLRNLSAPFQFCLPVNLANKELPRLQACWYNTRELSKATLERAMSRWTSMLCVITLLLLARNMVLCGDFGVIPTKTCWATSSDMYMGPQGQKWLLYLGHRSQECNHWWKAANLWKKLGVLTVHEQE